MECKPSTSFKASQKRKKARKNSESACDVSSPIVKNARKKFKSLSVSTEFKQDNMKFKKPHNINEDYIHVMQRSSNKKVKKFRKSKKSVLVQKSDISQLKTNSKIAKAKKMKKRRHEKAGSSNVNTTNDTELDINEESDDSELNLNEESDDSELNLNEESEDSEDDRKIRNELEELLIFKKIKKLLKDNPSLCFSEEDSSAEDSIKPMKEKSSINSKESFIQLKSTTENNCPSDLNENVVNKKSKKPKGPAALHTEKLPKSTSSNITIVKEVPDYIKAFREEGLLQRNPRSKLDKNNSFRNKAREKLQAAKFRFLNEKLYTESGKDSFAYFKENKEEFIDYHTGYSLQALKWPINPVDKIISSLQTLKKNSVIADMGCGDAKIAQSLKNVNIHSFDLVALNEHVTSCNISNVPLSNESVDIVVFCLSLMGINLKDYIIEARRILKIGGTLKIAEVESRVPSLDQFIKSIESLGFKLTNKDIQHKLFVFVDFIKDKKKGKKAQALVLNPCLYKKR